MKIAYIIHSLHNAGGMERILSVKASRLAEMPGYEVAIVTVSLRGRTPAFSLSPKVELIDLGLRSPSHARLTKALNAALESLKPHITMSLCGSDVYCLKDCTDGSAKAAEWHFPYEKYLCKYGRTLPGRLYARARTRALVRCAQGLDRFVVLTKADRQTWSRYVEGVEQVYNPLTFSTEQSADVSARRFVAVGRLEKEKNLPDLVRAWAIVASKHPDWSLDVYGDGGEKNRIQSLIDKLGVSESMTLRGRSVDVRSEMLHSSGIVMTSLFEGFPLVLLEAAQCGLPLVSYDCPKGPSEIVENGVNGFLVPQGDVDSIASGMIALIEDEALRKRMGNAAKRSSERFSIGEIMSEWDRIFRDISPR